MAGDWIKMRADLHTHPKVVRIASALNADRLRVVGGLHAVWSLFDAHSEDGDIDGYTVEAIDDLIGWPGFAAAMESVHWLERGENSVSLPGFSEHNGKTAKRRAMESERKRSARAEEKSGQVSAFDADKVRTREEKRREDIEPTSEADASEVVAGSDPAKKALPDCPQQAIVELWHSCLPELPRVVRWTDQRAGMLRSRWREWAKEGKYATEEEGLAFWGRFFAYIGECPFLVGRSEPRDGKPPFVADLEWVIRPQNLTKIIEGRYRREAA